MRAAVLLPSGLVFLALVSTYQAVPESVEEVVHVDHERGTYVAEGHVQLWGIDLLDPLESDFPADLDEAGQPPHADRIYDMDEDGEPGITLFVSGLVEGRVYAVQRKTIDLEDLIQGPDRALGLAENGYEAVMLGDDIAIWDPGTGSSEPWPDPKESWFEEVRIPDESDCDDVMRAEEEGVLSRLRPF